MEAQTTATTKSCPICKKEIDLPKYRLHEATCARNNFKCQECGEIVAKSEKEQHDQEKHTIVSCEFCRDFEGDGVLLKSHQEYCEMKPRQCKYCELNIPFGEFEDHMRFCGSKTQQCPDCKKMVTNQNMQLHKISQDCEIQQDFSKEEEEKRVLTKGSKPTTRKLYNNASRSNGEKTEPQKSMSNGRSYTKLKQQTLPAKTQGQNGAASSDKENFDADQQAIERLLQEDMNAIEADQINGEFIRPPIEQYEDVLIDADGLYESKRRKLNPQPAAKIVNTRQQGRVNIEHQPKYQTRGSTGVTASRQQEKKEKIGQYFSRTNHQTNSNDDDSDYQEEVHQRSDQIKNKLKRNHRQVVEEDDDDDEELRRAIEQSKKEK